MPRARKRPRQGFMKEWLASARELGSPEKNGAEISNKKAVRAAIGAHDAGG